MNDCAVALAEGVGELNSVEEVSNCLTNLDELCRTKVADEYDLAVAGALELYIVEAALLYEVKCRGDLVTIGYCVVYIEAACLKAVDSRIILCADDDDLLDVRLLAFEVTCILVVDFERSRESSLVKLYKVVRACRYTACGLEAGILDLFANVSEREVAGEFCAFAVVFDINALAEPEVEVHGRECAVTELIIVRNVIRRDCYREGVLIDEAETREDLSFTIEEILTADNLRISSAGDLEILSYGRAAKKRLSDKVLSRDGVAIVVYKAGLYFDCEGLGAILVEDVINALRDCGVDDVVTVSVCRNRAVIVDEVADHIIRSIVCPHCTTPVAADLG